MWRSSWQQDIKSTKYVKIVIIYTLALGVITYLFYNSKWAFIISLPLLLPSIKSWEKQQEIQLKQEFMFQFKDYLLALANAMGAGYAVENAMVEARIDLEKQYSEKVRLIRDLQKMERLMNMNIGVVDI